jgi:small ligand-binding sensory domain FIST
VTSPGTERDSEELLLAGSGLGLGDDWRMALDTALDAACAPLRGAIPDLLVLFAGAAYRAQFSAMLDRAAARSGARHVAGCSASGVIADSRELEDAPGIAALAVRLPTNSLLSVRQVLPRDLERSVDWTERLNLAPDACTGLILLADPFTTDVTTMLAGLERDYPGVTIVGGLATGAPGLRGTSVFCGSNAASQGAVLIGLGGATTLLTVVSQGCEPIGQAWTITDADRNIITSIGSQPAYQVLRDTIHSLELGQRERVNNNLLVGLAMDEYRDKFTRGDFLIRNLTGVDPTTGAIAVAAHPRIGQTLQFQIRDARAADEELWHLLRALAADPRAGADRPVAGALLFACNGRGVGLFGEADHDARTVRDLLGPLPLAGLFCNGEIGPVGTTTFIHGFTASLALLVATR